MITNKFTYHHLHIPRIRYIKNKYSSYIFIGGFKHAIQIFTKLDFKMPLKQEILKILHPREYSKEQIFQYLEDEIKHEFEVFKIPNIGFKFSIHEIPEPTASTRAMPNSYLVYFQLPKSKDYTHSDIMNWFNSHEFTYDHIGDDIGYVLKF